MSVASESARPARAVLVIEDEPHMQFLLSENLGFEGYTVRTMGDAETALAELGRRSFDLLIVDVMLPRMNGLEFCREVRARGLRTPVIMLTARSEETDRVIGLDLGADDYVTKPFSVRELLARRSQSRAMSSPSATSASTPATGW
jgi:two-component system, OmpR family, response regulator VicR